MTCYQVKGYVQITTTVQNLDPSTLAEVPLIKQVHTPEDRNSGQWQWIMLPGYSTEFPKGNQPTGL
eukprot:5498361-Ditylum_brightwellii.AAC.1